MNWSNCGWKLFLLFTIGSCGASPRPYVATLSEPAAEPQATSNNKNQPSNTAFTLPDTDGDKQQKSGSSPADTNADTKPEQPPQLIPPGTWRTAENAPQFRGWLCFRNWLKKDRNNLHTQFSECYRTSALCEHYRSLSLGLKGRESGACTPTKSAYCFRVGRYDDLSEHYHCTETWDVCAQTRHQAEIDVSDNFVVLSYCEEQE